MSTFAWRLSAPILLLVIFALACSDDGPSGPNDSGLPPGMARIAGQLSADDDALSSLGVAARTLRPTEGLSNVVVHVFDGDGNEIFSTTTDLEGEFAGTIPSGTYTIVLEIDPETELSFTIDVPEGATFFVEGEVKVNPSGKFTLDAEIFVDNDGDGEPDNSFRIRITGRVEGQPTSGDVDVEGEGDKVAVCHFPPGNPDNFHTIVIGEDAVDAHLAHGDTEGPCDEDDLDDVDDDLDDDGEDEDDDGEKVVICHIPPGNPENAQTIEVDEDAVEAHLAHGDAEGECEVDGDGDGEGDG